MLELPIFKIRCSAIHHIMVGAMTGLTEKQAAKLKDLEAKPNPTFNQKLERDELIEKRDRKPTLSAGAKTYCKEWLMSLLYDEPYEFTSKYTDKGNECEQDGIDMVAERQGYGYITKNTETFEDEYMTGTPDVVLKDIIEEIKCPYTSKTFPLFEKELPHPEYAWQQLGYMNLTKRPAAAVNYCLINAPMHVIEMEVWKKARSLGMIDPPEVLFDEVEKHMTYDNVPIEWKYKRYPIKRDEAKIELIKQQVILCREYIDELIKEITPKDTLIPLHDPALKGTVIVDAVKNS